MDVIFTHAAGLDGHKQTVMAWRVPPDPRGRQADGLLERKECGTMTVDLLALSDWLAAAGITQVAMDSVLRTGLTQLAHAAARTKGTYLSALYRRPAARRGKTRAIMAVAHSIVVSAFYMLSRNEPYRDLGAHDFDERRRDHLVDCLTRRIAHLGYRVTLEPVAAM